MQSLLHSLNQFLNFEILKIGRFVLSPSHVITVLLIGGITHALLLIFKRFLQRQVKQRRFDMSVYYAVYQITRYLAIVLAVGISIESLGFQLDFLLASTAALLVGLGIGLQHLFEDFISGIILLVDRTIKVNDVIEVDKIVGRVLAIKLRYTEVISRDKIHLLIPNSKLTRDKVINYTHQQDNVRFDIFVNVSYQTNVRLVEQTLLNCAKQHPDVDKNPSPQVQFWDFGESALVFRLLIFCHDVFGIDRIKSDIRFAISQQFKQQGIVIPFPQREVHLSSKD